MNLWGVPILMNEEDDVRKSWLPVLFIAIVASLFTLRAREEDFLYDSFQNPASNYRPYVRWWWNGGYVTEDEILRELDVMKAGGIGGIEINTIAMLEAVPRESLAGLKALDWLSPEWNRMVKTAAEGTRARGMTADLIVGSGWPFGGRFLEPAEQTKRIILVKKKLTGPQMFQTEVRSFQEGKRRNPDEVNKEPRLVFLRLVPSDGPKFNLGEEKRDSALSNGRITLPIPDGEFTLYCGLLEEGFTNVKLGAPGADGPVVNHFNAAAVRKYLENMARKLSPALGRKLGDALRAMFVDSLELDHANWTGDFAAEFQKRRGYKLQPYLPFILDWQGVSETTPGADTIFRARYDFCKTLVELFHERFLRTYIEWCHRNGVRGRIQAYGRETHPLEGSLLVDLPEGESWLWSDRDKVVPMPTVANKYVASAAHLAGKNWVSFEAMTNAVPVFRETLEDIKLCFDMSLATGVIHPVLHGFNYTPPEAGFPGWVRFGSYFNEKNPWWPYFRLWSDYAARLTAVLEQTKPGPAAVAILGPRADEWAHHGLLYQPFPEVALPWYHYHLWQAMQQDGVASDFVSESILQQATAARGTLRCGAREFEAVVLQEVDSIEPATARAIGRFAHEGVKIIFIGRPPHRSPGLQDAGKKDLEVQQAMASVIESPGGRVEVLAAPDPVTSDDERRDFSRLGLPETERRNLLVYAQNMILQFGLNRMLPIEGPSIHVAPIEHRQGVRRMFFFANTSRDNPVRFAVDMTRLNSRPWRWDPLTGSRRPMTLTSERRLPIHLNPAESLLLVLEPPDGSAAPPGVSPAGAHPAESALPVQGTWDVEFRHVDRAKSFTRKMETLTDLSKAPDDPAMATFAGTAVYRTEFHSEPDGRTLLDLGRVYGVSEATLNGTLLGVRWYGRHAYDTGSALRPGLNRLEVRVTTMLGNYCKSLSAVNPVAKRWASWFPPIASGMVGPVRLMLPTADQAEEH